MLTVASGPILAGAALGLTSASVLTGGRAGALIGGLIPQGFHRHPEYVHNPLQRDGLILWVLTRSVHQEEQAVEAMTDAHAAEATVQVSLK